MKHLSFSILATLLMFGTVFSLAQSVHLKEINQTRQKININANWKFQRDEVSSEFASPSFNDSGWETVSVPHTMKLEPVDMYHLGDDAYHQTFQRYIGWYRKDIAIKAKPGQKVFIEFEGAHQVTNCWVNGKHVGEHALGGYTPFYFDITNFVDLEASTNTIVLSVDNRPNPAIPPDGDEMDFIKFSGLYRDVYLVITNPVYITFPWDELYAGVFVTTPSVSRENATIQIRSSIHNDSDTPVQAQVLTRIIDAEGYVIQKVNTDKEIAANVVATIKQTTGITDNVHLWSISNPYLYRVQTLVYVDNELVDMVENPLGIRSLEFRKGQGFLLNGELIELIGVNKHQAYPYIGDAVPDALFWKDAVQIKNAGFNVVRLAHYPHDNAFIRACDQLGILLIEEAPTWISMRHGEWFDNLIEVNRRMIRNHRNHPSIIMWSGGINHRGPVEQLHYSCKEEDPTRVTGSNGAPWTGPRNSGIADIYTPMDYQNFGIKDVDLSFLCEHASSKDAFQNQFEVSLSRQSASRFGVAMWTAHDYFSFKHKWSMFPRRPFSIYRVPNPVMYWYQSEMNSEPMVHIADERAGTDNKVHVFSNCDEVELYNNDVLVARQYPDSDPERMYCNSPSFTFILNSDKGDLVAKGYYGSRQVARDELNKPGKAYSLKLVIEDDGIPFEANGWDIRMVHAYVIDENGNHVIQDTTKVRFSVSGEGEIIGNEQIGANPNKAYWGAASALLQSTAVPGNITVIAQAPGLKSSKASISTVKYEANRTIAETKPIFDYPVLRVDMGKQGHLKQFEWLDWSGADTTQEKYKLPEYNNAYVSVAAKNGSLTWTSKYGMSGNLPYIAMDGVRVNPEGQLVLSFSGLPKGKYKLETYHHSHEKITTVQGLAILIKNSNLFQISVNDANGNRLAIPSLEPSSGSMIDNRYPASGEINFISSGQDEVKVIFENEAKNIDIILNGFELKRIN